MNFFKKSIIAGKEFVLHIGYSFLWWWPVWFYIVNREGRKLYALIKSDTTDVEKRIIRDLKENGIAFTHIDELFTGQNLFPGLVAYAKDSRTNAVTAAKKKFLLDLWERDPILDLEHPFLKLTLNEKVFRIVSGYFDCLPKFFYYLLNVALPVPPGQEAVQSQRWHRDPEDKRMCKMFLYLNDVDEGTGPFTYVTKSQYGGKWRSIVPQKPPHGSYPPAEVVAERIPQSDIRIATARAGTIIFCDTSGIHKGGYATKNERIMFTAGFNTRASQWGVQFRYPENFLKVSPDDRVLHYIVG